MEQFIEAGSLKQTDIISEYDTPPEGKMEAAPAPMNKGGGLSGLKMLFGDRRTAQARSSEHSLLQGSDYPRNDSGRTEVRWTAAVAIMAGSRL